MHRGQKWKASRCAVDREGRVGKTNANSVLSLDSFDMDPADRGHRRIGFGRGDLDAEKVIIPRGGHAR